MKLPKETTVDPDYVPKEERKERSIERLPKDLGEALACLEKDDVILDSMGEGLARSFFEVRKFEWENLKDATLEQEVAIMLEKY